MRRDKITLAIVLLLFFGLLTAASGGLWLLRQPALGSGGVSSTLLGLGQDQVLSGLMILSLVNLVLLAGYLALQWPVLAAVAAALLPNPTVRALITAAAALGTLVLLSLPWLERPVPPSLSQPPVELPTPVPMAASPTPVPTPTLAPPARPPQTVMAVRFQPKRVCVVRKVPGRHLYAQRYYKRHPARIKPAGRPCLGWYVSRRLPASL